MTADLPSFERRNQILDYLREYQRVSTRVLSDLFRVSEVTIRHDLRLLEADRWLSRVHGGAEAGPRLQQELPMEVRETQLIEVKQRIAREAVRFVERGDTILLDSSTTAFQMTRFLKDLEDITVVTNNFHVARVLSTSKSIETIIMGGTVRSETWSIVGPIAEDLVSSLRVDKGFFGAAGLSLRRGLTDADIREAQIKRKMAEITKHIHVLVDSSKFGKEAFLPTIPLQRVEVLIVDTVPVEIGEHLRHLGIHIVLAE